MSAKKKLDRDVIAGSGPAIAATGCKQATFKVDASGQANYNIPIEVPPGVAGLQPGLAFTYSHRQGNDILGVGWNLNGLSAITRLKATYAVDGFNGGVQYDANDRFALDGQRMINVKGGYGEAGTVYYTELQTWQYIQAGTTPAEGFTVTQKNGQVYRYGATTDSRILASGAQSIRVWALSSIEDLNGNKVLFSYTQQPVSGAQESGAYYLDSIRYTVRDDLQANRFVKCTYEDRPDIIRTYIGGYPIVTAYRLKQVITSLADNQVIRTYTLDYITSKATGQSCINSITETGAAAAGAPDLPATTLLWQDNETPGFNTGPSSTLDQHSKPLGVQPLDINGDGCTDIVQLWQHSDNSIHATVYLATNDQGTTTFVRTSDTSLGAYNRNYQVLAMDLTGDGRTDLVVAYQSGTTNALKLALWLSDGQGFTDGGTFDTGEIWDEKNHIGFYAMDVNGDGRTDLVETYRHYDPAKGNLFYLRSWLSRFGDGGGQLFTDTIVSATDEPADPKTLLATWPMDVNGDGMTDMVRVWQRGSDSHIIATAFLSVCKSIDQVSFAQQVETDLGTFSLATQIGFFPADVNGDGMVDLLQVWQETNGGSTTLHLTSFICNGAGGFVQGPDSAFNDQHLNKNSFYPMGFNGGGQTDILSKWISGDNELMFTVYSSTPTGSFRLAAEFRAGTAGSTILNASFVPGDVNGDGKADLIRVSASQDSQPVIVPYLSTGAYPGMVSSITNPLGGVTSLVYAPLTDKEVYTAQAKPGFPAGAGLRYPNPLTPAQFPVQMVLGQAYYVVSGYSQSNDPALNRFSYSASYICRYSNAQVDMLGRGWQGFQTVSQLNLTNGFRTVQEYNQAYPYTGTVANTRLEADGQYATDPRVPRDNHALLLSQTKNNYQSFVRAQGATNTGQQVVEVLKMGSQSLQYDYGEDHFDFAIGLAFDYDNYGNQSRSTWLGYIDPGTGKPLAADEVVYQYCSYQNLVQVNGWALGYLLYQKTTANATDPDITQFLDGDLQLEQRTYDPNTCNLRSQGNWDNVNKVYLTTGFMYDAYGNQVLKVEPGGAATTYNYETVYRTFPLQVFQPANQQGVQLFTNHGYDPRYGVEVALRDVNGHCFITALDAFGRQAAQQGPVPAGTQNDTSLLTTLVTGSPEVKDQFLDATVVTLSTTSYLLDGSGGHYTEQQTLQVFPTGNERVFLFQQHYFDGQNRERQHITQSGQQEGNVNILTDYTATGNITAQSLPFFAKDAVKPVAGTWINYTYDVLDRKLRKQQPAGAEGQSATTTNWYYGSGGVVQETDAAGSNAEYVQLYKHHFYNSKDKVVASVIAGDNNATTQFTYDRIARSLTVTDPATASNPQGVTNSYTYDSLDRKRTADNPDQNTTGDSSIKAMTYVYAANTGFAQAQTNAAQQTTTFRYDNLGRVIQTLYADGAQCLNRYDDAAVNGNGKLVQVKMIWPDGSLQSQQDLAYDAYGNNTGVTLTIAGEGDAFVTSSVYDPQLRLVQQTLPDQSVVVKSYSYGVLVGQTLGDAVVEYPLEEYTALGRFGQSVYGKGKLPGKGIVTSYQYNPMGLLYGETVENDAGTLLQQTYAYDELQQLLGIIDVLNSSQSQSFTYANRRLQTARIPGFADGSYTYDAAGNIMSKDGASYTYHAHFPLTMQKGGAAIYSATQDACGNTSTRVMGEEAFTFQYNGAGALVAVQQDGVTFVEMLYDAGGRRIRQTKADGTVILYVHAAYQVERKGADEKVTSFLTDAQGAAAAVTTTAAGTSILYYRRDHKGNITLTFGAAGTILGQLTYDGYGLSKLVSGNDNFTLRYEQRNWEDKLGLYYFGARYYDPVTGRFLTPDSRLGGSSYLQADAWNRFAFELNNPVNQIDPTGHMAKWVGGLLIGVAILAIGVAAIATGGAAAAALAPTLAAALTISASTATVAVSTTITVLGSAAIAAGISATSYSLTHRSDFSWKDYWIETGISAGVGAVTGGLLAGLSAATAGIANIWLYGAATITGSGLISAGGDVTSTFLTNLAEGAHGSGLAKGLWQSAVLGFSFGAAGATLGLGFNKLSEKVPKLFYGKAMAQEVDDEMQRGVLRINSTTRRSPVYESLAGHPDEIMLSVEERMKKDVLNKPWVRLIQLGVTLSTQYPEGYIENEI